jgi:predicted nucleic acid-binding protein
MILVDTSVLIGDLKGLSNPKTMLLGTVLSHDISYGISSYTYQEVLQGARDEREFTRLRDYLSTQQIYRLPDALSVFERAARMFFNLRRRGVTPRSTIDILIALTAIENDLYLLHDDHDFDAIARLMPELKILTEL